MELVFITAKAIFQLFMIMAAGFLLAKRKIVGEGTAQAMTDIIVWLVNPLALMTSFLTREFNAAHTRGLLIVTALAIYIYGLMILLTTIFVKKGSPNWEIHRTITVYANVGYVGLPLITAVLGPEGVFFFASFVAVNTVLIFTHGETMMTGQFSKKRLLKCLVSPNIVGTFAGLFLYFSQIKLPELIMTPLNQLAGCNTCLAMLVAGITIANREMGNVLKRPALYVTSAVKALVMPALLLPLALLFNFQEEVFLVSLIGAACPAAAFIPIFALQENKDAAYAYGIFTVTTLGSIITAPLMVALYMMLT